MPLFIKSQRRKL